MKIKRSTACPCGSENEYKKCCGLQPEAENRKKYISEAHEWMDKFILKGRRPVLHGYLVLVEHSIPPEEIWEQLQFWSEQYLDFGENRTRICHKIIDEEIAYNINTGEQNGQPSHYCRKGCANCCYQPVACTDEEAGLIYRHCADSNTDIDFEKLERQNRFMNFDSNNNFTGKTNWDEQTEDDQACVFLKMDDRTCRIWEVRPFVCRVHMAMTTDKYCRLKNGIPDPAAIGIHYPACSYILSSIFTIHHDSIGKMMGPLLLKQKLNG